MLFVSNFVHEINTVPLHMTTHIILHIYFYAKCWITLEITVTRYVVLISLKKIVLVTVEHYVGNHCTSKIFTVIKHRQELSSIRISKYVVQVHPRKYIVLVLSG